MAGYLKELTIKGHTFRVPADLEAKIVTGGVYNTDKMTFGDGTTESVKGIIPGSISGLKVSVKGNELDILNSLVGEDDLPILYEDGSRSYELTGFIMVSDGVEIEAKNNLTNEFSVVSNKGCVKSSK